jgi:membrane protease subunit HflK
MPWSNQNGGGGGGWQGGGGRGPWGQGPSGGGNQPPDLDELIRRGQEKLRQVLSGGTGGTGGLRGPVAVLGLAVIVFLAWSSFFRVDTDQQGIVLRFGNFVRSEAPGLHMKLPYPIETVELPTVTRINSFHVGMNEIGTPVPAESLMLTGDENIADITFTVLWRISDAKAYLFNIQNADGAVKAVAESAMREVVGQSNIDVLQTTGRNDVQKKVRTLMQSALDSYGPNGGAGIEVTEVQLKNVDPPAAVIDAFRDVQAARTDQERLQNEATTYANTVVPKARGQASQITQAAEAYREQIVAEAQGETKRFLLIYNEYKKAKDVTRRRMYLETMQEVIGGINKVLVDPSDGGKGVLPYMPLPGLKTISPAPAASSSDTTLGATPTTNPGAQQ